MSKLEILTVPNQILYNISIPVLSVDNSVKDLMFNMLETMYAENGIGLAAPQVGINQRIIVMDVQEEEGDTPIFMANPKIISRSKEVILFEEGCLSVPNGKFEIKRSNGVTVEYFDHNGRKNKLTTDGLLAICIQHEIDHLDGITILESCNNKQ